MNCGKCTIWLKWWMALIVMSGSAYTQKQPHVVFIMVDDMGWNDISFHGSDQILTPNIDALAYRGVILHHYYSEAVCTPARTALLTGKYPMRLGMQGFPLYNSEDRGIPVTERLLPSYLKELGYSTHLVGKWHVGMSRPEYLPTSRGYDTHYGMRGGFIDYYTYNKVESWPDGRLLYGLDLYDNDIPQEQEQRYIVDVLTDRAIKIIQHHNASRPLFLHLTHNAPHAGNDGAMLQPPLYSPVGNMHIANSNRRLYANVVNDVDRSVGRVVRALADKGILDDTIIVFVSDNGAPTLGSNNNRGTNLPLRGQKFTPWEGAVRVPAFIWHSSFKPRVWHGLMHISDWLPTLIAAVGGKFNRKIDGVNQWDPILRGGESNRRDVLLTLVDSASNMYASYRAGDYKVVIGNVTGIGNDYYGADLLANRASPPAYYPALRSCEVAKIFESRGMYLDIYDVLATRAATTITQEDPVRDPTLCVPTPTRGCLFNLRRDPSESHDLWQQANQIAVLLTSRLRGLWAMQTRRGPPNLQLQADPANFGYNWTPWLPDHINNNTFFSGIRSINSTGSERRSKAQNCSTKANVVSCNGETGIRNFLCLLRSVF